MKKVVYEKTGKTWTEIYTTEGTAVTESLAQDLNAKYLEKASYIKSVKRVQLYTHKEITVVYSNGIKAVYTVPAHF